MRDARNVTGETAGGTPLVLEDHARGLQMIALADLTYHARVTA